MIIWYSRAKLSTKLNIDPINTNVQSLSITVRHEEHKNLTSIDPDNPVPLQYVLAGDGLKIITCYCEQDTQMGSEDPTNEAEETQQDESPEHVEQGNTEAGGNLMGDNPEAYTYVIEEVDNLKKQIETIARSLDVVRKALGNMEAVGNLMREIPEVYTYVIEEVDNLKKQIETIARSLDVVRHALGEIQFRIQQN